MVFFAIIKFAPLTLLERGLIVGLSFLLAWLTYRLVEIPFRFGRPSPLKTACARGAWCWSRWRAASSSKSAASISACRPKFAPWRMCRNRSAKWRVHQCLLDLSHETSFADDCVDRDRRPLMLIWGDSTAGALMPGLRKAQQTRGFGIAQFTSSSCIPASMPTLPGVPNCRAINDKVLALARELQPDIVLLHGTFEKHLDRVAETVAR